MEIKCPKCHSDNPDTQRFCGECGTQIIPSEKIPFSPTKTLETPAEEFTRGTIFAERYDFIEELGTGGMGKVYKVFDKKIKEEVALKILKSEIASDKRIIERFSNELKLARKIVHKNVGRMYELLEAEGIHYITMEYVPGEDLKSFIRRSEQLTVSKAISITKQVCEGLSEAHKLGVVHRDLKPSNIMIDREGNARIMDFGIARSLKEKGITTERTIIGTPEYMSPEQAEAKEVDPLSDIYSLGVILYEMVTGRVPFEGDTSLSIAMKHKSETPQNPNKLNAQIPEDLSNLILKCMEKDKEKRYQGAEALLSELTNIERGISTTDRIRLKRRTTTEKISKVGWKKYLVYGVCIVTLLILFIVLGIFLFTGRQEAIDSIAVLPLENLSGDSGQEYFVDGMTEALITQLSQISGLRRVISRTSVMMFKGVRKPLPEIAKELNVDVVVEGTVSRIGERVRITAKLIEAATERNLWAQDYERDSEDMLTLQKEVAKTIANEIKVTLTHEEEARLTSTREVNPKAYEAYLKGRYFLMKMTTEGYKKAVEYFQQAIEIDPTCALAYAGLADVYLTLASYGLLLPNKGFSKARESALKALKIDDTLAEAHAALGAVGLFYDWDWVDAEKEFKRSLELNPGYEPAYRYYARYLSAIGCHKEAIAELKKAQQLDPISLSTHFNLGVVYYFARQYDRAIEQLRKAIELDPTSPNVGVYLFAPYLQKSMFEEAMAAAQKAGPYTNLEAALTHAKAGRKEEARRMFRELSKEWSARVPTFIAGVYAHLGEMDKAFEWLQKGFDQRDFFIHQLKVEPIYDPLRSDPRFQDLLRRMNFPE